MGVSTYFRDFFLVFAKFLCDISLMNIVFTPYNAVHEYFSIHSKAAAGSNNSDGNTRDEPATVLVLMAEHLSV